jgi:hypothetical protein
MGYIMAVIITGKNFVTMKPLSEVSLLEEMGHCLVPTLFSAVILLLSGKRELLEQNSCKTNFQKFS